MKKSILIVLASILLSYPMNLLGAEGDNLSITGSETPHELSAGDTISADMFNEIFDYINNSNKMISASDLIGTWSCTLYVQTSGCSGLTTVQETDSLYRSNKTTLVMIEDVDGNGDADGTYSYTSAIPNIFNCSDTHAGLGNWVVKNNILFVDAYKWGIKGDPSLEAQLKFAKLKKVSNTKLLMEIDDTKTVFSECEKQNLPPITPADLTCTSCTVSALGSLENSTGKTVSLAWPDNSTDETGFHVWRKDSLMGTHINIYTTSPDTTSYSDDNVTKAAGPYWYRVSSTNSYGDSTKSKEITVDVP